MKLIFTVTVKGELASSKPNGDDLSKLADEVQTAVYDFFAFEKHDENFDCDVQAEA